MEMDTPLNPSKQTKYSSLDSYNDAHSHGHHSHGHGHGHGHGEGGDKINPDTKEGSTSHHSNHHGVVDVSLQKTRDREKRVLMTACSLCIIFMIAEIVGGLISGSLAILTDAAHLLSDLAGMLIGLAAMYLSERGATESFSYGYHRAEVLGALFSVALVWVMTGILVYEAIWRLMNPTDVNGKLMFIIATFGLIVNVSMAYVLGGIPHAHGHSHGGGGEHTFALSNGGHSDDEGHHHDEHHHDDHHHDDHHHPHHEEDHQEHGSHHGHGHGHGKTSDAKQSVEADIERDRSHSDDSHGAHHGHAHGGVREGGGIQAALVHVIGDAVQSVGVMIAAAIIWYNPKMRVVDPICTFVFALIVLCTTFNAVRSQVHILMEGAPRNAGVIREKLMAMPTIVGIHCFHCWTLTSGKIALSAHLLTTNTNSGILKTAKEICTRHGISHTTFQIECVKAHKHLCNDKERGQCVA